MIMKILISVSYYYPHISGLTNSIKNLAEGLAEKGHAVRVLTTQHVKNLAVEQVINGVTVKRVPYLVKLQKGFLMPLYIFFLIDQVRKIDCVLINLPQAEGVFAAIVGKLFRKRVVSVYACEVSLPRSLVSFIIEQILNLSHKVTLTLSDKVVALSDDYANHAKVLRSFRSKTVGIYPYIQKPAIARRYDEAISSTNSQTNLPSFYARNDKKFKIGYIGRISAEKGLEYLLQTIPLLKKELGDSFTIIIAGPRAVGEQEYAQKIEGLAKTYKHNVVMMPALKDDEMGTFYAGLDVLVLPSVNSTEAFGMVQVEAMFGGTPVVASDLPGVRVPILQTGMGEIARKKDSGDLAEKIVKVLKHKEEYKKKKKIAEEVFDSEKVIAAYDSLISPQ